VALAALACLTDCGVTQPNGTSPSDQLPATTAGQSSGQWRGPLNLPDTYSIFLTIGDTVIISSDQGLTGVDLSGPSVAWTIHGDWAPPVLGDATGLAVMIDRNLTVYDPRTGAVIGNAPMTPRPPQPSDSTPPTPDSTTFTINPGGPYSDGNPPSSTPTEPTAPQTPPVVWETLYWAGNGLVLTGNASDGTLCARRMTAPATCLWTAPNLWTPAADYVGTSSYVIAGKWVNTGRGVVDIETGEPAPFGADAGASPAGPVYYFGQTEDRLFRMTAPDQLRRTGPGTAQPWDATTEQSLFPAVPADVVDADPASSVFVATVSHADDANTVTAYSWASGQQLWTQDDLFQWNTVVGLSGNIYGGTVYSPSDYEQDLVLLDASTGQELARYPVPVASPIPGSAAGNGKVYVAADLVFAYDNQTGAKQTLAVVPEQLGQASDFVATPTHLAMLSLTRKVWVLDL